MQAATLTIIGIVVTAFVLASAATALFARMNFGSALSLAAGTLIVPTLICVFDLYWLATMQVDDAPPGMILLGSLLVAVIVMPISLLTSFLTLGWVFRRSRANVR